MISTSRLWSFPSNRKSLAGKQLLQRKDALRYLRLKKWKFGSAVKLRSNGPSFHEFRPRFTLFPVVGTGRIDVARGLVSASVVSRIVAANSSRIKGPDEAIVSVHSIAAEIFAKPRAVGTARLFEFHRPRSTSTNLERPQICPSHKSLEQGFTVIARDLCLCL
ncbi:hypothetical protein AVEN_187008-1 [Araneus ventricosus]|uniref:Uncharacterized protein n=1 Tax=Araneus ventricosus TaxID=182803 RepID=A0A4Y2TZ14_ARAVE|nr:hypothetical protein AVEN_187008-1 [Araneus ventricosus]